MRIYLTLLLAILCAPLPAQAEKQVVLVLDASGSMWGQIDGKAKITIAREVIDGILQEWNSDNSIGLVTYGHRRKGDCGDIETLIPVGRLDRAAFNKVIGGLNPKGKTPMTAAVELAAETLRHTENAATVILVSDGEETCDADPCTVAAELEKAGIDFTAHVIGFDVTEQTGLRQLQCIAGNTGGEFLAAKDAPSLKEALKTAVKKVEAKPESVVDLAAPVKLRINAVLAEGGPPIDGNDIRVMREELDEFGKSKRVQVARDYYKQSVEFMLPPGEYIAVGYRGNAAVETPFTLRPGTAMQLTLVYNAALVKIHAVLAAGLEKIDGNDIRVMREVADEFGKVEREQVARDYYKPEVLFTIPAGTYITETYLGSAYAEAPLVVEPGKSQEQQLVYNASRVKLNAVLAEGGDPVGGNDIRVYREKTGDFGKTEREQVARDYYKQEVIFTIPAGAYVATSDLGSAHTEAPLLVEPGKSKMQTLVYNAGRLKLRAVRDAGGPPVDGNDFRVLREGKDEFGKAKMEQIARDYYKSEVVFTVPAGEYELEVYNGEKKGASRITVPAGQAVEATLQLR